MANKRTNERKAERRALRRGALAILVFAVVAVAARGVRWDETWEHAQILSGQVVYPEGHPLVLYVHNAFSLQTFLSASLLAMGAGPFLLCGIRNVLFLLATMLPVYALTTTLTRSVHAGLLAAILMMQGVMLEFDGSYPTMVWPEIYSNGHIGGGVVLLALAALVAARFRTAFFLLGLIPCIHVGQWPPLAAATGLYGLFALSSNRGRARARTLRWLGMFSAGLALTVLFWLLHHQFTLPLPDSGPFAAGGDTVSVWKGYTAFHDPHRRFPPGNGHVILAGTILLAWMAARWGREGLLRRACIGLAIYSSVVGVLVWGTMAIHALMGPDMPFVLIAWMPYRLINHIPAITLALMIALILSRWPQRGWWIVMAALLFGIAQPLWPFLVGEGLNRRYLAGGECVTFFLFGVALFAVVPSGGPGRWWRILLVAISVVPLAMYHRFGAVCEVAGLVSTYTASRVTFRIPDPDWRWSLAAVAAATCALVAHQSVYRQELPRTAFQSLVAERVLPESGAMLLAPPDNLLLQATTNLPVLAEVATPSLISYVPGVGPAIDALYLDIYGISLRDAYTGDSWETLWRERPTNSWKMLSKRYGFTHVLVPSNVALDLTEILAADDYHLYAVGS